MFCWSIEQQRYIGEAVCVKRNPEDELHDGVVTDINPIKVRLARWSAEHPGFEFPHVEAKVKKHLF